MLLCEDTVRYYPSTLMLALGKEQTNKKESEPPACLQKQESAAAELSSKVLAKFGKIEIPKNKAARKRLVQSIRESVDKLERGTQFKKKGAAMPNSLQRAIKQVVK